MLSSEAGLEKMPPHCDTRDGPVVKAAMKALDTGNIHNILIWIPELNPEFSGKPEKVNYH